MSKSIVARQINTNGQNHHHQANANGMSSNGKAIARLSKKINEVREVVQNRPEAEILKVLEFYDNDVGRTINAFVTGKFSSFYQYKPLKIFFCTNLIAYDCKHQQSFKIHIV